MKRVRLLVIALALVSVAACESFTSLPSVSVGNPAAVPPVDWQNSRGYDDGH